jgi:hypothetical protein
MQDMSDLRKSIAERLGSAAKFTMSAAKYRAFVYRGSPRSNVLVKATEWMDSAIAAEKAAKQIAMSFRGQPGYNSDNYFADIAQETPMGAKTVKNNVRFSRPGAKAQFAGPTGRPIRGLQIPDGYFGVYERSNRPGQDAYSMWVTLTNGQSISLGSHPSLNGAMKIGQMLASGERKVKDYAFSRPGAKAKFAEDAREVAQEILRQLGGGRFMAMVGGKNAFHGTFGGKPGLQIDIGKGAEGGINRLIVKLDRGSDTYDMEFWRVAKRGMDVKKVSEASGVYADDLQRIFTSRTKFYTSLSRPGAKAKMAADPALASFLKKWKRNEADNYHSENVVMLAKFVGTSGDVAEANRIMQQHDEMGHLTPELNSKRYALYTALKAKLLAKYPGVTFSRPGAKAKMGREYSGNSKRLNNGTVVAAWDNGDAAQFANATQAQSFSDKHGLGGVYQSPSSRTFFVLVAKATASRPGAKGSSKAKA